MIARLRGELVENKPPYLMIDVAGVGYAVEAPMSTVFALPPVGSQVTLLTHLQVREDAHTLYGFLSDRERALFRELLKVNGIGARMALATLSTFNPNDFRSCVLAGDVASLTRVPGIGKKTAERMIVEMRDRLEKSDMGGDSGGVPNLEYQAKAPDPVSEAEEALVALGYKPQEASRMVARVETDGLTLEAILKQALKATIK